MDFQFIWTKFKYVTVEPVLFLYMMLIFLESNALQELISVKSCLEICNPLNISFCSNKNQSNFTHDIEQEKTYWIRLNGAVLFFFTFISSFFVASWSDKFGRKLPMLIPPIGTVVAASINCVLSNYMYSHMVYILISSTISGLTFGTVGIVAATFGFIADVSDELTRTKRIVILEAMIYIGGTLGIYIGGEFLNPLTYDLAFNGFTQLFVFEICIALIISFYILFRISNPRDNTNEFPEISCKNLFQFDHIKNTVKTVFRSRDGGKRKIIILLLLALFLIYFGLIVQFTLAYYYLQDVLQWKFHKFSGFNSIQFAVEGLTLLIGMPVLFYFNIPDHLLACIGILSKMIGYIVFGISSNDILVYSCIALYMFSEFPVPAIRSMLSKIVDVDEKGRIFAFTTILQNFCFLLGSITLTTVYKSTLTIFPGLCFEIVATLQAVALSIIIYLYFTKGEVVTTYEIMENDDGSVEETCVQSTACIN